ncbi:MAG: serine hydrolase domain-containing protein [Cyanobacteria bacterium P01_F01_bin.143]
MSEPISSTIPTALGGNEFSDEIQLQLENFLSDQLIATVPGASIAIASPLGNWSEAQGLANIDSNTAVTTSDRFEIGSVTKTFTVATILKLVESGTLTLEDKLTDWLPIEVTDIIPNASEITLRQLLNHTSGVAEYDVVLLERAAISPAIFLLDLQPEEILGLIEGIDPFFSPGESWQYSNTNFILAGMVIEAATGNNIAAEIRTQVLEPLELNNTFFAEEEEIPDGYISGYFDFDGDNILDDVSIANLSWSWTSGAMISNTEDLTHFAQALYAGDLLEPSSREEMFDFVDTGRGYDYGLGVMSFETPDLGRIVGHRGGSLGFSSNMWYSLEDELTYVTLLNGRSEEDLVNDTIPLFTEGLIPTIGDTAQQTLPGTIQVSLDTETDLLIETEETVAVLNFSLSEPPPESGLTISLNGSDLLEFDFTQIQAIGGEIGLTDDFIANLDTALDNVRPDDVPGAAAALVSPFGSWFGASGVSSLENETPLEPSDRFEIGSITKTFVATRILQLVEDGLLDLEDKLTDWLPEEVTSNVPNAEEITLEQMLQHTSGIANYVDILFGQAAQNPGVFLEDWRPEQLVEFIDGVEPLFEPGESWTYSNTNFLLLGMIIEAATENNIAAEIREGIIEPLGLDNTFFAEEEEIPGGYVDSYWDFDNNGILNNISVANLSWAFSAGAMVSNLEDLDTFARNLFAGDLLEPETLERMLDTVPAIDNGNYSSYGLGVGTIESPNRLWYIHRGQTLGQRSNMWYLPESDLTYIELINGFSDDNLVSGVFLGYRQGLAEGNLNFTITEQEATIRIPILNDEEIEGSESVTFTLETGEGYEINPDASNVTLDIIDVENEPIITNQVTLDTPFIRFQNSDIPGTYVYVTETEAEAINDNLPGFVEEGVAFNAAIAPHDDLVAFSRLENNQLPGTFLYVGETELTNILDDPNFSNAFTNQGVAFYTYGVGSEQETAFSRFHNDDVPGTYLYATGAEADTIRANSSNFVDEGIGFEAGVI